ncbi:hypothetical protein GW933_00680 [Candidatus Falkowbacteria bacterium]|uniref:Uncharacterized protein n=1 Tax=Candidatus Buchananbacteria bacterium CG10_big_fil_rev_8_21_14_0_10_33_19 TaxID=1974525 RepID=A0A2H0W561_9BACT|nr:hypothetical protein [Candidatus Falkowbacteria bacterium]PIS05770.1 MAG: hypothetical protein COT80_03305 [Candidatus Buchananbacteria bacterium CG10_big_fil_rev_8_21_14_0_10_33_19]
MNNFTEKVLEVIKHEKPESKWKFKLKNYAIWLAGSLFILFGSLSTAVVIYMIANNDWAVSSQIATNKWQFILLAVPIYWVATIIILLLVAYYNFRHTSVGYRYKILTIIMSSIVASIIFGGLFYYLGLGHIIDKTFAERIPIYERFASPRRAMWVNPDDGRLAGKVIFIRSSNFDLIDFYNKRWLVEPIMTDEFLQEGQIIKIIGQKIDDDRFRAERILPFDIRGQFPGLFGSMGMHRSF